MCHFYVFPPVFVFLKFSKKNYPFSSYIVKCIYFWMNFSLTNVSLICLLHIKSFGKFKNFFFFMCIVFHPFIFLIFHSIKSLLPLFFNPLYIYINIPSLLSYHPHSFLASFPLYSFFGELQNSTLRHISCITFDLFPNIT